MKKKKPKGTGNKIIPFQPSEEAGVPNYYVNNVKMAFSVYDIVFEFGVMPPPEDMEDGPDEVAKIRMSPQHAKVFSKLLAKQLEAYESEVGEIPISKKLLEELKLD